MTERKLTKTRLVGGIWEGLLTGHDDADPKLVVTHKLTVLDDVTVVREDAGWSVRIPVPSEMISDGAQTFVIRDAQTDDVLNSFTLLAGEGVGEDMRAEVDLLRAELDLLKRAFRRHCVETM